MAYQSFKCKLIYVFAIYDEAHKGCVKVGDTTLEDYEGNPFELQPNCKVLNAAADKRIQQYTSTAGIQYKLLHTELTTSFRDGQLYAFNDGEVHNVLVRSGIKRKIFNNGKKAVEWFVCDVNTVKAAITAAKEGRKSIDLIDVEDAPSPIIFRPEQEEAIKQTIKRFRTNNQFLWNAKMRFGKTLSAMQVVKEMEFEKTIIVTHRPVVDAGWFEDFRKIFYDRPNYKYGSRSNGESLANLLALNKREGTHFIFFASMQDLRGSALVGGNFDKNNEIFSTEWDLLIIDEAHEGTKTELGQAVINNIFKGNTKMLQLSGTPFNLLDEYKEEDIFTWDYVMEQRAKAEWDETHWGDPNPYAGLPKLNIYTFDLGEELKQYQDDEHAFNFAEFFRVKENGSFLHDSDVDKFLDLLASNSAKDYPYSKLEWRQNFRHTLWTVPSVAAAKALSEKIRKHRVLSLFQVVNVAGDGDTDADYESDNALEMVNEAITDHPEETYTITLSRGRLTTGVSVKAWTAVFMLHGSFSTSAMSYMQTIFRAQTPAIIAGKQKQECYVFDFAPDRTLKVLAETAKVSSKAGKTSDSDRKILGDFLNFCPVISMRGAQMSTVNVEQMMQQLKRVYVDRVVKNGFEDTYLYNDKLLQLSQIELEKFANLREIIGQTKAMKKTNEVDVNRQGFTNEEYEEIERIKKKPKKEITPEEAERLKRAEEQKKQRATAISILRGISIRMPMILYGATITDEKAEITLENFTSLVDDASWEEFMPKNVTKELFEEFIPYYDEDVFAAAGLQIRKLAREADTMDIEQRIERIASIFNSFRNPDKETVLTPWRVVNMQLADTLGGFCFFDDGYNARLAVPRLVSHGAVTEDVFGPSAKVLEINSKSGLYPLYVAYTMYRNRLDREALSFMITDNVPEERIARHRKIWNEVLRDNIFVVCKTPMAKAITIRTLAGFTGAKVNTHAFDDLINQIQNKQDSFIEKITRGSFWNLKDNTVMKFNAIVGNPPYQSITSTNGGIQAKPLYNSFMNICKCIYPQYISLIFPTRWYARGIGLDSFRTEMLADKRLKSLFDFPKSRDVFPTVDIAGGICYLLWDSNYDGKCYVCTRQGNITTFASRNLNEFPIFIRDNIGVQIVRKVQLNNFESLQNLIFPISPYGLPTNTRGEETPFPNSIRLITSQGDTYIGIESIGNNIELIDMFKVIIGQLNPDRAGVNNSTSGMNVTTKISICQPNEVTTATYLVIGAFYSKDVAINYSNYMRSKFSRFLLSLTLSSMHITRNNYQFVPLQDFTDKSDIDWSKSVAEIDQQLYAKYGLSADEVAFIESMIKPM